jgi:hypothetical protein
LRTLILRLIRDLLRLVGLGLVPVSPCGLGSGFALCVFEIQ